VESVWHSKTSHLRTVHFSRSISSNDVTFSAETWLFFTTSSLLFLVPASTEGNSCENFIWELFEEVTVFPMILTYSMPNGSVSSSD
jgi:hypothetical protein